MVDCSGENYNGQLYTKNFYYGVNRLLLYFLTFWPQRQLGQWSAGQALILLLVAASVRIWCFT